MFPSSACRDVVKVDTSPKFLNLRNRSIILDNKIKFLHITKLINGRTCVKEIVG